MVANYDAVLSEMRAAGLILDGLDTASGKTVRCKVEGDRERRGWYRLSEVLIGDEYHLVGAYGIWHGNDNGKVPVRPGKSVALSAEQREAINARIRADQAKAKAQRAAEAEWASVQAAKVWRRYLPEGKSSYLERKGVQGYGVRFHPTADTFAIPMMDARGQVWGLELIRGKDRGEKLAKQFWPRGADPVGHWHLLGGSPRDLLLVTEGYATAASLHEAFGIPAAVAFSAGNLLPVCKALRKQYPRTRILICADDDFATFGNPGASSAAAAAIAIDGRWLAPVFTDARQVELRERIGALATEDRETFRREAGEILVNSGWPKLTDFNDLHALEGLAVVRTQLETFLAGVGWLEGPAVQRRPATEGAGAAPMVARLSVDEAVQRYWGTYGMGGKVLFDSIERRLVHKDDVLNLLPRHGWENMRDHPDWRVARDTEIGFDPTESDAQIKCNLFGGWPTEPKPGTCTRLLELLEYLCSGESNSTEVYDWVLDWLAYPLQHRGAKMHSAIVIHGPQGTGKSLFFEAYGRIFGEYGRILGQEALEDKFNADWAEKKLYILADEVLARGDMFHVKNRLKGFITGGTIRVNPKNVAAHNEKNQMNIVFLSNERQPLVLEEDDRRHCVIWVPPKLPKAFFDEVTAEIDAGGIPALHHFLLTRDLGDFSPASHPPSTSSKRDLIVQSTSSEERFVQEWRALELEAPRGGTLPFCPCLGADLYRTYRRWCDRNGERARRAQDLIGHCNKLHGWQAGKAEWTWRNFQDKTRVQRKLVIPAAAALEQAVALDQGQTQERYRPDAYATRIEWATVGYLDFANAVTDASDPGY